MPAFKDITGQRFGRLITIRYLGKSRWECRCDCGNIGSHQRCHLASGGSTSCGCFQRESARAKRLKHGRRTRRGMIRKPGQAYMTWQGMKQRCHNSRNPGYKNYGGRGITVCDRWKNSFDNFLNDMGEPPSSDLSIERKNNDSGYSPENCIWATRKEQANNTRRNHHSTCSLFRKPES